MVRAAIVVVMVVASGGCDAPLGFKCDPNGAVNQCVHEDGRYAACISATDRCAVPAPDCPSGWRYDTNAGSLAGKCVPPSVMVPPLPDMTTGAPADMASDDPTGDMAVPVPEPDLLPSPPDLIVVSTDMAGEVPPPPADMSSTLGTNTWAPSPPPNTLLGTDGLTGIWGTSSTNLWAVGIGGKIIHYDGSAWAITTTPVAGTGLYGVWGSSAGNVWAVGIQGTIIHYDGTSWTKTTSPTTSALSSVWGTDATHVWITGASGTVLSLSGSTWTAVTGLSTHDNLGELWGDSAADVYAAGLDSSTTNGVLAHLSGSWSVTEQTSFYSVGAVGGSSSSDFWIGGSSTVATKLAPQMLHWNGSAFSSAYSISAAPKAIWSSGPGDVWAAAGATVQHFDTSAWVVKSTSAGATLYGLWGFGPHDVWAVGSTSGGPVILHGQ
jgi:hypothetical protein